MKFWEVEIYGGGGVHDETSGLYYTKSKREALAHIRDSERGNSDEWPDDAVQAYDGVRWSLQLIDIGAPNFDTIRACLLHLGYVKEIIKEYIVVCKDGRIVSMEEQGPS